MVELIWGFEVFDESAIKEAVPFVLLFLIKEELVDTIILSCANANPQTANTIQTTRVTAAIFRNVFLLMVNLLCDLGSEEKNLFPVQNDLLPIR